jgi:hypothetical protein
MAMMLQSRAIVERSKNMSDSFKDVLLTKLNEWVQTILEPDKPIVGIGDGNTLSPRQILQHVNNETLLGKRLAKNLEDLTIQHVLNLTLKGGVDILPADFDQTDLRQTFERICALMNSAQYDELKPLFHPDLVYSRLHHPGWYRGSSIVIDWLNAEKKNEQPQFMPDMQKAKDFPASKSAQGTIQHVGGPAKWKHRKGEAGEGEDIQYIFTFVRDNQDRWLLFDAHGQVKASRWAWGEE